MSNALPLLRLPNAYDALVSTTAAAATVGTAVVTPPSRTTVAARTVVVRHRLVLSYDALADEIPADYIVSRVLAAVPLPSVAPRQQAT